MHISAVGSLGLLALSAKGVVAAPPNGYSAFFSTFNHPGCDIQSLGMTTVEATKVGDCVDLEYPATSVNLDEVQEGCWLYFYPYARCKGQPYPLNEPLTQTGCFNSDIVLTSARVTC
ncbi:uncharacterized protein DNG_09490 [Cephalotrichum gorgonifer]|uniref:Uncharacterized protein n=1 Tax=Cephalotrichum gorgonifer TaxID=2041049 RepID=A0AAE8SZC8_9PEZI|nr:uncharacterized protein DNG_09490 [Cephalotrichum gorgonifer]